MRIVISKTADDLGRRAAEASAKIINEAIAENGGVNEGTITAIAASLGFCLPNGLQVSNKEDELADSVYEAAEKAYEQKEQRYGAEVMRELERVIMLRVVDEYWMEHIDAMDDLKQGIGLRAYGQHDPVVAYKEEGFAMFEAMVEAIREETVRRLFLIRLRPTQEVKRERVAKETGTGATTNAEIKKQPVRKANKAGPNDPCPCGSGKKYKKCCMQKDKSAGME